MRLGERLARLERAVDYAPGMSAAEIDAAAARYEAELVGDGTPVGQTIASALASWRRMVEQAAGTWQQRIWAAMSPDDLTV